MSMDSRRGVRTVAVTFGMAPVMRMLWGLASNLRPAVREIEITQTVRGPNALTYTQGL